MYFLAKFYELWLRRYFQNTLPNVLIFIKASQIHNFQKWLKLYKFEYIKNEMTFPGYMRNVISKSNIFYEGNV